MLFFSRYGNSVASKGMRFQFQSRNRDAFLFKNSSEVHETGSFCIKFQSRNRDAFLFKMQSSYCKRPPRKFQSRNRDAFLFKKAFYDIDRIPRLRPRKFQSRNRDAFLFKAKNSLPPGCSYCRFNLVIEMLFFSRRNIRTFLLRPRRFNLVIEMLFFSSTR